MDGEPPEVGGRESPISDMPREAGGRLSMSLQEELLVLLLLLKLGISGDEIEELVCVIQC